MMTQTQLARHGLFDAKVPRYTSYPTAPHFSDAVGSAQFVEWVEAIPEGSEISLYVHIPFCRRLCWFCACRTQGTATGAPLEAYLHTVEAELALVRAHLPRDVRLSRLHWGGGTPTLMSADQMRRLATAIRQVADFGPGAEFSVEIDPNEIDETRVNALVEMGMNRASIGVQDFNDAIQKIIGRLQGFDLTRSTVDMLRAAGVASLNADILFGLPDQTRGRITETVQKLLSLGPDRVALYGYAHVPWMAKRQQLIPADALPTPEERLRLFETARRLFVWDGYAEIGIDHFAVPSDGLAIARNLGRLRRNFQGYTDDAASALIGVGASSISRFPQGYAQNASATSKHGAAIQQGAFATTRGHRFSGDDQLRGRLIEAVMCDFQINTKAVAEAMAVPDAVVVEMCQTVAKRFEGLVEVTSEGLFIPADVRPLTRMIARAFDDYDLSRAGHSSAI